MNQSLRVMSGTVLSLRPIPRLHLQSTMAEAARQMFISGSDAALVLDDAGDTLGIITSRDVVSVVAESLDPECVTVEQRLQSPRCDASKALTEIWFS